MQFIAKFVLVPSLLMGLAINCLAHEIGQWPTQLKMTRQIFAPHLVAQFTDTRGIARFRAQADNLDQYIFRPPKGAWKTSQSCDEPERSPGYLQTSKYVNESEPFMAKIGIPISLSLRSSVTDSKKEQLLNSTLLTVRVFALDGDDGDDVHQGLSYEQVSAGQDNGSYQFIEIQNFKFRIRDICALSESCQATLTNPNIPINLNFKWPLITEPFLLEKGNLDYQTDPLKERLNMLNRGKIRIRAEWSFRGICDEEEFTFKVADQFRVLQHLASQ